MSTLWHCYIKTKGGNGNESFSLSATCGQTNHSMELYIHMVAAGDTEYSSEIDVYVHGLGFSNVPMPENN